MAWGWGGREGTDEEPSMTRVNSPRGAVKWARASLMEPRKISSWSLVSSRQTAMGRSPRAVRRDWRVS